MNQALARLSPLERRFVVGVLVVVFLVMNFWWVQPHFGDWSRVKRRLEMTRETLRQRAAVTNEIPKLQIEVAKLEQEGAPVPPEDQARDLTLTITEQAQRHQVNVIGSPRSTTHSNQFFVEIAQTLPVQASEKNLVEFLYDLGEGNSMIRARDFSLGSDQPRYALNGNITLVASYQRNPPPRPAATPGRSGKESASKTPSKSLKRP